MTCDPTKSLQALIHEYRYQMNLKARWPLHESEQGQVFTERLLDLCHRLKMELTVIGLAGQAQKGQLLAYDDQTLVLYEHQGLSLVMRDKVHSLSLSGIDSASTQASQLPLGTPDLEGGYAPLMTLHESALKPSYSIPKPTKCSLL